MTLSVPRVLAGAWTLWRRDRDLLLRIAAPFLFLPSWALQLLVAPPATPDNADLLSAMRARGEFVSAHAGAYLLALAATQLGLLALVTLYCDPARPDARGALRRAAALWPRYVLASLIVALPTLLGMLLLVVPALLVLGRTLLVGPLLVAEQPLGAAAAIGRSVRATTGQTLPAMAVVACCWGGQFVAGAPFAGMDRYLRSLGEANPLALAIVDAASAGVDMLAGIAGVLVAVSAYRLLGEARRGT